MVITRNGMRYKLTSDEIYQAHKEFVTEWMKTVLQTDFGLDALESTEYAEEAYSIYSSGDGLTEYEAIEKAVEKCKKE